MTGLKIGDHHGHDASLRDTHQGMAYFARTGPAGKTCRDCHFWSNVGPGKRPDNAVNPNAKAECWKYVELMSGRHGPEVPSGAHACKYYEDRHPVLPPGGTSL